MTVKELRKRLKDLPGDMEIVLQVDEEGNGYNYLRCVDECIFDGDSCWSLDWSADEAGWDLEEDWEIYKKESEKSLVLSP